MTKALIIDDDEIVKTFMQRMLTKKFGFEVILASDGIEGLSKIAKEKPDLVFCDISMPLMDGTEVLQAIRTDPKLAQIPVVILTSHNERFMISKFLQLDVIDYILKPLDYEETTERLRKVVNKYRGLIRSNKKIRNINENSKEKNNLLFVDQDVNFRSFFNQLYGSQYNIIEASNGAEGLATYLKEFPEIVILSEGLEVINEFLLAKKIRNLDAPIKPEIFLFYDIEPDTKRTKILFEGVLKKSFVPESFSKSFSKVVQQKESTYDILFELVKNNSKVELHSSIRQTVGVLLNEEINFLSVPEPFTNEALIASEIQLIDEVEKTKINFGLVGSKNGIEEISKKLLGTDEISEPDFIDAFSNICETIVGRLRSSFETKGIKFTQQLPIVNETDSEFLAKKRNLTVIFKTDSGYQFTAFVDVIK